MAITNKIITRGFGPSRGPAGRAGLITQGYGAPSFFVEAVETVIERRRVPLGSSSRRRPVHSDLEHVIVWAKLIQVNNDYVAHKNIQGSVRVDVDKTKKVAVLAEKISHGIKRALGIRVTAKRIK